MLNHRKVHLIVALALLVIAGDAYWSQSIHQSFLTPDVWATIYTVAASAVLGFVLKGTLRTLQAMTVMMAFVGLFRGVAYIVYDGRLTPLALNTVIACYSYLAHLYERGRMRV